MEPAGSLPHSQTSATCLYPGPAQSSPYTHIPQTHPNIIHPSTPRSHQWSPSLQFPHQDPIHPLSSPIRATCPAHLILLDFITRTILGEEYKPFSSSLFSLFHSPVITGGCTILICIVMCTVVSESNCFLRWGCTGNMSVDFSEDGGGSSSLINDITMSQFTRRHGAEDLNLRFYLHTQILIKMNNHAKAYRSFTCPMSVY